MPSINLTKVPFSHHISRTSVVTIREAGEYVVGQNIAEAVAAAAVAKGHATWIEAPAETKPAKAGKKAADAATDTGQPAGVDRKDLAPDDSADGGAPVADAR